MNPVGFTCIKAFQCGEEKAQGDLANVYKSLMVGEKKRCSALGQKKRQWAQIKPHEIPSECKGNFLVVTVVKQKNRLAREGVESQFTELPSTQLGNFL